MSDSATVPRRSLGTRIRGFFMDLPWFGAALLGRLFYSFRVEGRENMPDSGPYIISINEQGLIGMVVSGYVSIVILNKELEVNAGGSTAYMQEELFAFSYFRKLLSNDDTDARDNYRALVPHAAGRLGLGLLDGYRTLMNGGIVIINPEGDATWNGRPVPMGRSLAWLALHTAAPIVPTISTIGCYEIWPRWQRKPGRGRLKLIVGEPIKLCDEPMLAVPEEALAEATARLREHVDKLAYGPEGVEAWVGPSLCNGEPLQVPLDLGPAPAVGNPEPFEVVDGPAAKRGVAQLLWQCPICQTDESLLHRIPRFRPQTVTCQACDTRWQLKPVQGHDFRLKVLDGAPHLAGLDLPLSAWYDQMKQRAALHTVDVDGVDLLDEEVVRLTKEDVPLLPYRPNALFGEWPSREAPKTQLPGRHEYADWDAIGEGRLFMSNKRLLWQSEDRELDFFWSEITAVSLFMQDVLAIKYGDANYRFKLSGEFALKWLTYAARLAQAQADLDGHELSVTWH